MKIIIPSHKRADKVTTIKVVDGAAICVPESQVEEYKMFNSDNEIIGHPDSIVGISPKRNWIYKMFGDVFMLDDDVTAVKRTYLKPKEKREPITAKEARNLLFDVYHIALEARVKVFGFSKTPNPLHYNEAKPIYLNGFIQGCAMGLIRDDNLYFPDTPTLTGEDEFIALLNAYYNRTMYIDKRFFFQFKRNNTNVGGCEEIRTDETSKESYFFLRRNFGDALVRDKKNRLKWRLKIPY